MKNLAPLILILLCGCGQKAAKPITHNWFVSYCWREEGGSGVMCDDITMTMEHVNDCKDVGVIKDWIRSHWLTNCVITQGIVINSITKLDDK